MAEHNPHLKRFFFQHEETLLDLLIRYGLYISALFQVTCLLSLVIYHRKLFDGVVILKVNTKVKIVSLQVFSILFLEIKIYGCKHWIQVNMTFLKKTERLYLWNHRIIVLKIWFCSLIKIMLFLKALFSTSVHREKKDSFLDS